MSRNKIRMFIAVFVTVAAFSAVAASAASAEWFVNGVLLTTSKPLATTAKLDGAATLSVPTLGIEIKCTTGLSGVEPEIIGGTATGKAQKLEFEGCETIKPTSGCGLSETTIPTMPVIATVSLRSGHAPADLVNFAPQSGKQFAEIPFSTADTCGYAGDAPVKGQVLVNAPTGQSEEELQAIEGIGSAEGNNSLEVGSNKSFIEGGNALLKLASAEKWSFK